MNKKIFLGSVAALLTWTVAFAAKQTIESTDNLPTSRPKINDNFTEVYTAQTVVDGTDATSFVAIFDAATGFQTVKTDGGLLYNASTGALNPVTLELGAGQTDTTLARSAAGAVTIEGNTILLSGHTFTGDVTATLDSDGSTALTIADNSVDGTDIALGSDAAGDIMYYDGTNWVRLAKGTAGQVLEMNAGATAPEWGTDGGSGSLTATYVGFGDGSNALTGEAAFAYNSTTNTLTVENISSSGTLTLSQMDVTTLNATNFTLPNSDDPDVSVTGRLSYDTDGWLRLYDGTNQVAVGRKIEAIHCTVVLPNDLADSERDAFWVWSNESGMSFVVTGWKAWSDTDDTDLNIEEIDADGANNVTVDAVTIATNGTGLFTGADTTITGATIENGHLLVLDFDDTDTPGQVKITVYGYFNADVN